MAGEALPASGRTGPVVSGERVRARRGRGEHSRTVIHVLMVARRELPSGWAAVYVLRWKVTWLSAWVVTAYVGSWALAW